VTAGDPTFWDRTYRDDPDFFGAAASSLARSSLGALLRDVAGGTIYELGTGTGRDLCYFAQHGFDVAGCDTSPLAARASNVRLSALRDEVPPLARVRPVDALTGLGGRSAGGTDVVYSNLFYNLEADAARLPRLFQAVARVLRPGGWHIFSVRSVTDPWYGRGRRLGPDTFEPAAGNPPLRFFDEPSLRQLAAAEFDVLTLREHPDGGPEFPVVLWSAVTHRRAAISPSRP
jgi:SAM-dependent methyltransferase